MKKTSSPKKETLRFRPESDSGELSETSAKSYFSIFGLSILAAGLASAISSSILSILIYSISQQLYANLYVQFFLSTFTIYLIAFPIGYIAIKKLPSATPLTKKLGVANFFGGLCVGIALMLIGNYFSQICVNFFTLLRGGSLSNPIAESISSSPIWLNFLSLVILAPIAEELFFRKLICKKLLPLGEGYAIILSGAAFALFHRNFFQIFYAFLLGVFFALIYLKTGRIIYSMIYHMIINFMGGIVAPWILSKLDIDALLAEELTAEVLRENIIPLSSLLAYEMLSFGAALIGIILLSRNYKKIKLTAGIIPPPRSARISCVFMNIGIAAAIAYFAFELVTSII